MDTPFSGEPSTIWIVDAQERLMELTSDFSYIDRDGNLWKAPKGMHTDGASIPRALWTLVGSPFTGHYRRAALVHDHACDEARGDQQKRREADRMFYFACRDGGCPPREATILYIGVRIGAIFDRVPVWGFAQDDLHPRLSLTAGDQRLMGDFQQIARKVLDAADAIAADDITTIERETDAAITSVMRSGLTDPEGQQFAQGALMEQQVMSPLSSLHILYEIDGHLYTTFIVATQAGLPRDRALELAWGSQVPDANRRFTATNAAWDVLWSKHAQSIMKTLHSLHGGGPADVQKRRNDLDALIRDALRQKEPDWKVGLMIHAYGDSYAHTYVRGGKEHAYGIPLGHAGDGHAPDKIGLFGQKYLSYVTRLFQALGGSGDAQLCLGRLFQIAGDSSGDVPGVREKIVAYAVELGMSGQDSDAVRDRLLADVSAQDVTETMGAMERRFAEAG